MPQMGESVTEGTVLEWHKKEGDFVEEGETVVEVSTDKVDAEVPAPASGTLTKILKGEDETVEVGAALAELDTSGEASASGNGASAADPAAPGREAEEAGGGNLVEGGGEGDADIGDDSVEADSPEPGKIETPLPTAEDEAPTAAEGETVQLLMPEMGESVTEGTVLEWHKSEGDAVEEGETVVEVSTDKVDAEVPAPASGTITKLFKQPDETVKVGEALAEISAAGLRRRRRLLRATATGLGGVGAAPRGRRGHRASPVARRDRRRARRRPRGVKGSGGERRITKADVLDAADGDGAGAAAAPAAEGETKPLRGPAAMLAKAMDESRSIPTATSFRTLAVDTLDAKRRALNGGAEGARDEGLVHAPRGVGDRRGGEGVAGHGAQLRASATESRVAVEPGHINLGIAVDVERKDGSRSLMVPRDQGRRRARLRRLPRLLRGPDHQDAREPAHAPTTSRAPTSR